MFRRVETAFCENISRGDSSTRKCLRIECCEIPISRWSSSAFSAYWVPISTLWSVSQARDDNSVTTGGFVPNSTSRGYWYANIPCIPCLQWTLYRQLFFTRFWVFNFVLFFTSSVARRVHLQRRFESVVKVFLCLKETLNNALKHSNASLIIIDIAYNNQLKITITDNGAGIDLQNLRQFGNGLKNMARRMESIGGTFTIENNNGTVTTLELSL